MVSLGSFDFYIQFQGKFKVNFDPSGKNPNAIIIFMLEQNFAKE